MRILEYKADCYGDVKYFLKNNLNLSTGLISKLKKTSGILVNQNPVTVRYVLNPGDVVQLIIPYSDNPNITSVDKPIEILYEDEDVICINKPCAMPSHPSQNHHTDTLTNLALNYLRKSKNEFHIVTRLDSYTSGIVLAAKNQFSASEMCTREYNMSINKRYVGVCRGRFDSDAGVIEASIGRCTDSVIKREVSPYGKYAKTGFNVIERRENKSLVEFKLYTGRTHQIRVHASYINHALVNDFLYDDNHLEGEVHKLHCRYIEFKHPYTNQKIQVYSQLPDGFW